VKGIVADNNILGHFGLLLALLQVAERKEFWIHLALATPSFAEVGLADDTPDRIVWETCQMRELVLLTTNRNQHGPNSLEATIRALNTVDSLPVLTIGNGDRMLQDKTYAAAVADRVLQYLFDIDVHRGAGRLYVP
jgi:hypothetical protein